MSEQNDFEALARRYWQAWGDAMRPGAAPAVPGWNETVQWWTQLAQGVAPAAAVPPGPAGGPAGWLALMQQLASRFAGTDAAASDIAGEWRRLLGANPLPDMLRALRLQGQQGLDAWFEATAPLRDTWQREMGAWLHLPAFGSAGSASRRRSSICANTRMPSIACCCASASGRTNCSNRNSPPIRSRAGN